MIITKEPGFFDTWPYWSLSNKQTRLTLHLSFLKPGFKITTLVCWSLLSEHQKSIFFFKHPKQLKKRDTTNSTTNITARGKYTNVFFLSSFEWKGKHLQKAQEDT